MIGVFAALSGAPIAHAAGQTVVSLTFDDERSTQSIAGPILEARGMRGTFFVNSGPVGSPGHLTWGQLSELQSAGHEIAGHTLDHKFLPGLSDADLRRQVCEDRGRLINHGFPVANFAYPYGYGFNDNFVRSMVQQCGYNSARRAWGLVSAECTTCTAWAETIPPADAYAVRSAEAVKSNHSLDTIKGYITNAEANGGGWVILVLHDICDGCDSNAITRSNLEALLDWLKARESSGTIVKTMKEVIGGAVGPSPGTTDTVTPVSSIGCGGGPCSSGWYTQPVQVALSATDTGDSGLEAIRYTTDGSDPSLRSPVYSAPLTVSSTTTVKFQAWDNAGNAEPVQSQLVRIDAAAPLSSIACNGGTCSGGSYTGSVEVSLSATDGAGSGVEAIRYTTDGSDPSASSAVYSAPFTVASTTTVKFRAWDNAGNTEPVQSQLIQIDTPAPDTVAPVSSIACNGGSCSSGWYTGAVEVALSATDSGGSGLEAIRYTTDGSDPSLTSAVYGAPFAVASTTTVKFRAWDNAGNAEPVQSQLIRIDTAAPVSSVACNGGICSTGWYGAAVNVSLAATDNASGVAATRYTLDGSDPTASSTLYGGPFTVSGTTTVKFRSWDTAGNAEATKAQLVRIDTQAPSVAITAPASGSTVSGVVKLTASASDAAAGVVRVDFYANGVLIGTKTGSPYTVNWQTKKLPRGSYTLTAVAYDAAGNRTTSAGVNVTVG